jgi:flagellar hook-length control protein FliK
MKLNPATENKEADVSLQKTTVFGQSAQNASGNAIPSTDSKEPEKQALTATIESTSVVELEKTAPDARTEMLGIQKPAEAKTDNFVIAKPVTHPGWSKDLGEQIVWMNNKEIAAAEIKLNPLHLGPISIRIDVGQDNQTSIQFTAQHAETKEALEASIPKLREMLQGQQLNLVNVNISQNTNSNHGKQPSQAFYGNPGRPEATLDTGVGGLEIHEADAIVSKGLLSLYA